MSVAEAPHGSAFVASRTLASVSVRFMTAVQVSDVQARLASRHTILDLSYSCLDVVERQVLHLVLQAVEIHVVSGLRVTLPE